MKRALALLAAAAAFALWGYGTVVRVASQASSGPSSPPANACRPGTNCAECHEGSVPRTHTPAFVEKDHGTAARVGRESCLGCHEVPACDDCHRRVAPRSHTEAFRHPARGAPERAEHGRSAHESGSNCLECHGDRFLSQCAACHRPEEWPER